MSIANKNGGIKHGHCIILNRLTDSAALLFECKDNNKYLNYGSWEIG